MAGDRRIDEMTRVLEPGGAVVILTTLRRAPLTRRASRAVERATGVRFFGPREVTAELSARGCVEIRQRSYALMQLVAARLG